MRYELRCSCKVSIISLIAKKKKKPPPPSTSFTKTSQYKIS